MSTGGLYQTPDYLCPIVEGSEMFENVPQRGFTVVPWLRRGGLNVHEVSSGCRVLTMHELHHLIPATVGWLGHERLNARLEVCCKLECICVCPEFTLHTYVNI